MTLVTIAQRASRTGQARRAGPLVRVARRSLACGSLVATMGACAVQSAASGRAPSGASPNAAAGATGVSPDNRSVVTTTPGRGTLQGRAFHSSALGVRKHLMAYLPPSYFRDTERRYPVAYYLHGLSGSETDWLSRAGLDAIADSLTAAGHPEAIIVLPDGDDGWYADWASGPSRSECADSLRNESAERYCVERQAYDTYIARDVVAFIDGEYRTRADRDHRGIGGLSMGGYGATMLALRHPDVFGASASHSGVVSMLYTGAHPFAAPPRYAESAADLRSLGFLSRLQVVFGTEVRKWRDGDPARVAEALVARGGRVPALYLDCGTEDGLVDENRALHWELTQLGVAHAYHEWPGAHTWRYWTSHVDESLAWMLATIAR